ncbi:hypothetical protein V6N11_002680 [Hibiscus sabdariffa]|uniref:SIT4 phosphatase-associated family protein n=1 Tax=Hibiscus sabdariffa TaxID=183260 RepID=A0ABR2SAX7_9ROSI
MAGLSTASPVETILDKENFTLEELLDEDEIIQECKALNGRLINFLREKAQVEQLLRYVVVKPPEDADNKRTFKFPFISCELFTCEVDIILKTLVEDEELMNLLFSFLDLNHSHSTPLAGYFSKVVICLLLRKTLPFLQYVKGHQEIVKRLVDLIGITSVMEVLIRLIGADEHMYSNYKESMQWIEDTDVLEMIVDKFSSSDSAEVHANAAEALCAITRFAPPGLVAKITSPNFTGRLFRHALEDSRPKSVLVNSLSVCISLLDPKRLTLGVYHTYRQVSQGSMISAKPETVEGMLESLDVSLLHSSWQMPKQFTLTKLQRSRLTYRRTYNQVTILQPPLGKHRLKIVEFVSVLLTIGSEAAEKELIRQGAVPRILNLFFVYPYNNFLHHHVENMILSCLESKNVQLVQHLLCECNILGKILEAEKNCTLTSDPNMPTVSAEGRAAPRIGNIGHLTRISNKLVQLGNSNGEIQAYLQENSEWTDWHTDVLSKRNAAENVYQWACGRPTALHDRNRDSDDDDDYHDRDYDVAALANNLSQAYRYGIFSSDDIEQVHGSIERDDEDVYFDDESAEVVISSLRLGDDRENGSLFTNSNWFALEDDRVSNECSTGAMASALPNAEGAAVVNGEGEDDDVVGGEDDDLDDIATSSQVSEGKIVDKSTDLSKDSKEAGPSANDKPPAWVEWRETPGSNEASTIVPNGELQMKLGDSNPDGITEPSSASSVNTSEIALEASPQSTNKNLGSNPLQPSLSPLVTKDKTTSGTESAPEITVDAEDVKAITN